MINKALIYGGLWTISNLVAYLIWKPLLIVSQIVWIIISIILIIKLR